MSKFGEQHVSSSTNLTLEIQSESPPGYDECNADVMPPNSTSFVLRQPVAMANKFHSWANDNFFNYLKGASSFHIKQKAGIAEQLLEFPNEYTVMDQAGNDLFYVDEKSDTVARFCIGKFRAFSLTVKDLAGQHVLIMDRPTNCSCFCNALMPDAIAVSTVGGQLLGSVVAKFSVFKPKLEIRDATGQKVLEIKGPFFHSRLAICFGPIKFKVKNLDGMEVGHISKQWSTWTRELLTDADNFTMSFPADLDLSIKAVCLAAFFLIDYEYFEGPE